MAGGRRVVNNKALLNRIGLIARLIRNNDRYGMCSVLKPCRIQLFAERSVCAGKGFFGCFAAVDQVFNLGQTEVVSCGAFCRYSLIDVLALIGFGKNDRRRFRVNAEGYDPHVRIIHGVIDIARVVGQ